MRLGHAHAGPGVAGVAPSTESHVELVCTAGITESREWVPLYPIEPLP
jgi:hypothetical protein